jgi:glycosyltransferase involved in cell wall biosynthesis
MATMGARAFGSQPGSDGTMTSRPLVSVVMIFLNEEVFLEEAIESVFAQTYGNWELLLVDDGSTDGSYDIARRWAARAPGKVRILEHPNHENRGMSASRNVGIGKARGEYVAFLDGDDVWLPEKLEEQLQILHSQPDAAMLYANTRYWYSWTGHPADTQRDYVPNLGVPAGDLIEPPVLLRLFLQKKAGVPCMSSVMVRRQIALQFGGFEERFRGLFEDQVFYAKVCVAASVIVADGCWDLYRQHPASTCATAKRRGQTRSGYLTFLTWLARFLADHEVHDRMIWRALRYEIWRARHSKLAWVVQQSRRAVGPVKVLRRVRTGAS